MRRRVAALYVDEKRGPYAHLPGVEAWGATRDATGYAGPFPVVTHPPCGAWGRLRQFATTALAEKHCAPFAVAQVRKYGGVLEHPAWSSLWKHSSLPFPGEFPDQYGGYTLEVDQVRWGHPAQKRTWLYIVGVKPGELPPIPPPRAATCVISRQPRKRRKEGACQLPYVPKSKRHLTPPDFAEWLVEVARRSRVGHQGTMKGSTMSRRRPLASPPLPRGDWSRGKGHSRRALCKRLERAYRGCGSNVASPCRETAFDRGLAARCPWAVRRINTRPYSGRLWRE